MKPYSEELVLFIENNRMVLYAEELCEKILENFNKEITPKTLRKYFYRHDLDYKKKINPKFIVANNSKPIGTESKPDKNGLIRVKVSSKRWIYKQRYIYEQHYGKIPKGYCVMFLDGNNTNFDISNLICVKNNHKLYVQSRGLIFSDKEITKTGLKVAELYFKTKEREKYGKRKENKRMVRG